MLLLLLLLNLELFSQLLLWSLSTVILLQLSLLGRSSCGCRRLLLLLLLGVELVGIGCRSTCRTSQWHLLLLKQAPIHWLLYV